MQERQRLEAAIEGYRSLSTELQDYRDLIELGEEEGDQETVAEAEAQILSLQAQAAKKQLESLLSGEADPNDAFIEINAGAGGTEAQDWAGMLLRLYSRWANAHGYSLDVLEESAGEEAGIKSTTLQKMGAVVVILMLVEIAMLVVRVVPVLRVLWALRLRRILPGRLSGRS